MVDLTITEANVDWVSGGKKTLDAAETITAGDVVYAASSTTVGVATNADANKDTVVGIALNAATAGQPCTYAQHGAVVGFGAILTVGVFYVLSATGAISPITDSTTSDYVALLGYATTTSNLQVYIVNTGLQQG